jgi:hypothetical protein
LDVYNFIGEKIYQIVDEVQVSGRYSFVFPAKTLGFASGVYFVKLNVNEKIQFQKLIETK